MSVLSSLAIFTKKYKSFSQKKNKKPIQTCKTICIFKWLFEAGQRISEEKMEKDLQSPALDQVLNPGARRFHARRPLYQEERRSKLRQGKLN